MLRENNRIEIIKEKAKAKEAEKAAALVTVKRPAFNTKTRRMEVKELVIKSGKEANSFKRIGVIAAFIGLEVLFFAAVYAWFIQSFLWFLFIPYGIGVVFACRVAVSGKNSDSKIAWILFLLIFAPIAVIVYLLAGEMTASPVKSRRLKKISGRTMLLKKQAAPDGLPPRVSRDIAYIQNVSAYAAYYGGGAEYFVSGEDFFEDVLERLRTAERFIFMDFFILEEGQLANAIFEILTERARAGVDVKIITDGLGSHGALSLAKVRRIKKQGIKIVAFEPVLPIVSFFINYRNHRKIIVIDGKTGYVGGANIADEYINAKERFGVWKDAALRIEGGAVCSLTLMFLRMWEYSSKEKPDYSLVNAEPQGEKEQAADCGKAIAAKLQTAIKPRQRCERCGFLPHECTCSYMIAAKVPAFTPITGVLRSLAGVIIPYSDGPNEKHKLGKGVYANIIMGAQKTLYIMTPYFIVDSHLTDLLAAKAKSGVDVRLVIPGKPDKKTVYALTKYNAERLIPCGVRVYAFSPGFLHSKVMFSDSECAVAGSINMDYRSLYQQYESAAYISNSAALSQIENDFINTFAISREITLENAPNRNILKKTALAVLRLFAPLM